MHPAPVETLQQSAKFGCRNAYHNVLDAELIQPLGNQAQARAIPRDQLDPVSALCSEDIDHPGIRIAAILTADECSHRVRAFAEIQWPRCQQHSRGRARADRARVLGASITAAITPASAPRAIFTATPSISSSTTLDAARRRRRGLQREGPASETRSGVITAGTKPAPFASNEKASSLCSLNCLISTLRQP